MRKTFCTACAVLLSVACLGTLVACGDGTSGGNGGNGGNGITEETDPKTLVSEKLTKAEWNNAFSATNFDNVELSQHVTYDEDSVAVVEDYHYTYAGNKRKIVQSSYVGEDGITSTTYLSYEYGKYYMFYERTYVDGGDGFIRERVEKNEWDEWTLSDVQSGMGWIFESADYSKAAWNSTENGYVFSVTDEPNEPPRRLCG